MGVKKTIDILNMKLMDLVDKSSTVTGLKKRSSEGQVNQFNWKIKTEYVLVMPFVTPVRRFEILQVYLSFIILELKFQFISWNSTILTIKIWIVISGKILFYTSCTLNLWRMARFTLGKSGMHCSDYRSLLSCRPLYGSSFKTSKLHVLPELTKFKAIITEVLQTRPCSQQYIQAVVMDPQDLNIYGFK